MDYSKLALAAMLRREILEQMGIESIHQSSSKIQMAKTPDATFEQRLYDVYAEVLLVAKMLEN